MADRCKVTAYAALAALWAIASPAFGEIVLPAIPQGGAFWSSNVDEFTVRVREPGGSWRDLYEYKVRVNNDQPSQATMVFFDHDGPVEVAVRKNNGDVRRVQVRPASSGVKARLIGDTAYLTLASPTKLSVEFDGDRLRNLHLFTGRLPAPATVPTSSPSASPSQAMIEFGPGTHKPPTGSDAFVIPSDTTVRLAAGALLVGGIDISNAKNVRIVGHGLITGAKDFGIRVAHSTDITIDGPIVVNPGHYSLECGQSTRVTIRDFKAFSQGSWTDGIDMMSCSDVRIDDVFLRNSDDTIAIYGGRWKYSGDARDYLVTNAILWADVAHPINIGLHGTKGASETIANLVFRNIDILEHDEDDPDYQGALAITAGDDNFVRNILFEDIRIERIEDGIPFNFRVVFNQKYSHAPGGGIDQVTVRNLTMPNEVVGRPLIAGFNHDRQARRIRIENMVAGGRRIVFDEIETGRFVTGVTVN